MTQANAIAVLMALTGNAVQASTGIARYDSKLYAVYYSRSHTVRLYLGDKRASRAAARSYLQAAD